MTHHQNLTPAGPALEDTSTLWLTDTMLAARYGVHRSWVWRRLKADPAFPQPIRFTGGMTRWRHADVVAWEQAQVLAQQAAQVE